MSGFCARRTFSELDSVRGAAGASSLITRGRSRRPPGFQQGEHFKTRAGK
jgi:hypothetical protein